MTPKQLQYVLKGAISLAVLALLFGAYGASVALQAQAERAADVKAHNEALVRQQELLAQARADIETYAPLAEIARSVVPQVKDQAQTVRELVNIAAEHGVTLGAVTFPTSNLGSGNRGPELSQLRAVSGIEGMYALDFTISSANDVPYANLVSFLDALEHNRRTAIVDGISMQPQTTNPNLVSFTLNITEYIQP